MLKPVLDMGWLTHAVPDKVSFFLFSMLLFIITYDTVDHDTVCSVQTLVVYSTGACMLECGLASCHRVMHCDHTTNTTTTTATQAEASGTSLRLLEALDAASATSGHTFLTILRDDHIMHDATASTTVHKTASAQKHNTTGVRNHSDWNCTTPEQQPILQDHAIESRSSVALQATTSSTVASAARAARRSSVSRDLTLFLCSAADRDMASDMSADDNMLLHACFTCIHGEANGIATGGTGKAITLNRFSATQNLTETTAAATDVEAETQLRGASANFLPPDAPSGGKVAMHTVCGIDHSCSHSVCSYRMHELCKFGSERDMMRVAFFVLDLRLSLHASLQLVPSTQKLLECSRYAAPPLSS